MKTEKKNFKFFKYDLNGCWVNELQKALDFTQIALFSLKFKFLKH